MRHILFVDDEPSVLSGLRRMLHPMRSDWHMTFVDGASAALSTFDSEPVDVVVADMRMPGMDGATLLERVRERWPETVRIILSGYADEDAAIRSVAVAHQFLSKPCDPMALSATVREACQLRDRLAHPDLRRVIGGIGALPSQPETFTAITMALSAADATPESVTPFIEQDPGCVAKLLQLVNSAFFGLAKPLIGVAEAVRYLGMAKVRDIVIASGASELFRSRSPELAWIVQEVGKRSASVAIVARDFAPGDRGVEAYVAGLLHDVGRLALASVAGERYLPIWETRRSGENLVALERDRLKADHADVGGYLLRLWGLPAVLVRAVGRHCELGAVDDPDPVVAAVARAAGEVSAGLCRPVDQAGQGIGRVVPAGIGRP